MESKYLSFVELIVKPHLKTKIIAVNNKPYEDLLGYVKWYAPWRKYCFFPNGGIVFDAGCLTDITNFINTLMQERRKNNVA